MLTTTGTGDDTIFNFFLADIVRLPFDINSTKVGVSRYIDTNGYYSHGKQFIKGLPVPAVTAPKARTIEKLVKQAIGASIAAASAKTPHARLMKERYVAALREQIEKEVSALFVLNDADLDLLKAVPIPE